MPTADAQVSPPAALVQPMRRILRLGGLVSLLAVPVVAILGWLVDGSAGLWGALLGLLVPVAFFSITAATALLTAQMKPEVLGFAVLGTWLLKIILLMVFLAVISGLDFYNRAVFFGVLLIGVFAFLALEAAVVLRTRVAYVEPVASAADDGRDRDS